MISKAKMQNVIFIIMINVVLVNFCFAAEEEKLSILMIGTTLSLSHLNQAVIDNLEAEIIRGTGVDVFFKIALSRSLVLAINTGYNHHTYTVLNDGIKIKQTLSVFPMTLGINWFMVRFVPLGPYFGAEAGLLYQKEAVNGLQTTITNKKDFVFVPVIGLSLPLSLHKHIFTLEMNCKFYMCEILHTSSLNIGIGYMFWRK